MRQILLYFALFAFFSCTQDVEDVLPTASPETRSVSTLDGKEVTPGKIRIKLSSNILDFSIVTTSQTVETSIPQLNTVLASVYAHDMKRVIPYDEARERLYAESELDLWYDIYFDESIPVENALHQLENLQHITCVLPAEIIRTSIPEPASEAYGVYGISNSSTYPYNDEYLERQWNLHNNTTRKAGINMPRAWQLETGHPDVIVAVIGTGVDANHPDLQYNMWEDANGANGRNFVDGNSNIGPGYHETMVAGIIVARNNNGIGISSIAGGTSSKPGVKIMSCQITNDSNIINEIVVDADKISEALIYAADNGAVIANCSFSSYENRADVKAAIDYFVNNAGKNSTGIQTGPMKGGLVVCCTGNTSNNTIRYPAGYSNTLAVTGIHESYMKFDGATYGNWVDLSAPGSNVYSTGTLNGTHIYFATEGTSFAAPHVAGVAALVVSQKHRQGVSGYTPTQLKNALISSAKNIDSHNSQYSGQIGAGLVDAYRALGGTYPEDQPFIWPELELFKGGVFTLEVSPNLLPEDPDPVFIWEIENSTIISNSENTVTFEVGLPTRPVGQYKGILVKVRMIYTINGEAFIETFSEVKRVIGDSSGNINIVSKDAYSKIGMQDIPNFAGSFRQFSCDYYSIHSKELQARAFQWVIAEEPSPGAATLKWDPLDWMPVIGTFSIPGPYKIELWTTPEFGNLKVAEKIEYAHEQLQITGPSYWQNNQGFEYSIIIPAECHINWTYPDQLQVFSMGLKDLPGGHTRRIWFTGRFGSSWPWPVVVHPPVGQINPSFTIEAKLMRDNGDDLKRKATKRVYKNRPLIPSPNTNIIIDIDSPLVVINKYTIKS